MQCTYHTENKEAPEQQTGSKSNHLPRARVGAKHTAGHVNTLDLRGLGEAHLSQCNHHLLPKAELLEALHSLNPLPLLRML